MAPPGLWSRIRDARLARVLAIYLAASWLLLQVTALPGIAVLPFSVPGSRLYFRCEGMVDVLTTNLGRVGGLRAIDGRTLLARWREQVSGTTEGEA